MTSTHHSSTTGPAAKPVIVIEPGTHAFVMPYIEREYGDDAVVLTASEAPDGVTPAKAVMLSTTGVYDASPGDRMLNEQTPLDETSEAVVSEKAFADAWRGRAAETVIMRLPHTVGTGMNGLPIEIAAAIKRGTMVHMAGNETLLSVVHAVDVAALVRRLPAGVYNATDGTETSVQDLVEALAWRMGQKRIFTLKSRWARLLMGRRMCDALTRTATFANGNIDRCLPGYKFNTVTHYLRNHVYDESSL